MRAMIILLAIAVFYGVGVTLYHREYVRKVADHTARFAVQLAQAETNLMMATNATATLRAKLERIENERKATPPPRPASNIMDVARDLDDLNDEIERRR